MRKKMAYLGRMEFPSVCEFYQTASDDAALAEMGFTEYKRDDDNAWIFGIDRPASQYRTLKKSIAKMRREPRATTRAERSNAVKPAFTIACEYCKTVAAIVPRCEKDAQIVKRAKAGLISILSHLPRNEREYWRPVLGV